MRKAPRHSTANEASPNGCDTASHASETGRGDPGFDSPAPLSLSALDTQKIFLAYLRKKGAVPYTSKAIEQGFDYFAREARFVNYVIQARRLIDETGD